MPRKRQVPTRPTDMNELAHRIARIATGEVEDSAPPTVSEAARKRGEARSAKLSPEQRKAIAKKAARARWGER
jgi:hypothetical protein